MKIGGFAARFALMVVCGLMTVAPAQAKFWQCVTFARSISGIEIYGNARTWWDQAAGRYDRGEMPQVGSVMSFRPIARMPLGHVAMVSEIVSDREVLLTHANWSHPGQVERNVRAIDVSPNNDWSQVRVWYAPIGALGGTTYPINGFIYPETPDAPQWPDLFAGAEGKSLLSLALTAAG
ncbi:MAG: CHAP domain-containing protein [Sphingomonas sp.]|nr:CHAP domain-containing protein [Sphingomonas sp.]|tara:strand:- start:73 stop:609 length:537 start_codon:yes stop_codon:yes gene_type:complete